ncbi:MAG TPA: class I tRNA ligase family protein, partial [Candidatus Binatus sp.]|nr:class I tRNA ligase family protein [Candidatus Binatus sp.]
IIEALSDSTIYMVYYILAKYIAKEWMTFKKFEKDPDKLMDEFFDYIFLGRGDSAEVATITAVPKRVLESIRKEFESFYPVDMRHSAKELIPNHFSFYIFNHVALFPRQYWPRGIAANGHVLMSGQKMSKSLQNIIPLRDAIKRFGADPVRIGVLATAEIGQDTDFSEELALSIQDRLVTLLATARRLGKNPASRGKDRTRPVSLLDKWILHRLNETIRSTTTAMETLRVRETIQKVLYQIENDVAWYLRRLGPPKRTDRGTGKRADMRDQILQRVLETRAKMLAPLAPHVAEEIWSMLGGKGMLASASWPEPDDRFQDQDAEVSEDLVKQVMEDTAEILKATGIRPAKITYYTSPELKWTIYLKAIEFVNSNSGATNGQSKLGDFIKSAMSEPTVRSQGKAAADYATKAYQQARQLQDQRTLRLKAGMIEEARILGDATNFFEREFKATARVANAGSKEIVDPKDRARMAEPYRPAIYIE